MASNRYLEELQRDLLGGGQTPFQAADEIRSLAGGEAQQVVQALTRQVGELAQSTQRDASNSSAGQPPAPSGTGGTLSNLATEAAKTSGSFLMKGLTLAPLVEGLLNLFRRDSPEAVAAPVRFSLPAPIKTEAGLAPDGQTVSIDRGAGDRIRPLRQIDQAEPQLGTGTGGAEQRVGSFQNITVQVNAMDSRSFIDHSEDIARAVRDAMLHSHALNDVVNDI